MANLNANLQTFFIQWPNDATLTLIRERRLYQNSFTSTPIQSQKRLWRAIALEINNIHPNFAPNRRQCKNKWNALKSGYENLKRLINENPDGYPTRTPSLHDERFHEELSDEFWLVERNYLLSN
ncbi:MAG: myb/SANT-like DNA-binding domain-containing protein [Thaumarchaeota archaeon]|nr:MAG: myb/SANT-like DNA-binding domain-containing protein [Nitrososphaerota archaeon]